MHHDSRLTRLDDYRLQVDNRHSVEATLFANADVPLESAAVDELSTMLDLPETVDRLAAATPENFDQPPEVVRVAVTPDFHKARGIPVGTVLATKGFSVPQAIGNDINCGMRLHVTALRSEQISTRLDDLETTFRHIFFEGGRNIPMLRGQREALLTRGLEGLFDATPRSFSEGLWGLVHELRLAETVDHVDRRGSLAADASAGLDDWLGPADRLSRDSQIGSIGGGNHFVEIQRVERIIDGATAHAWGLRRGAVTIMVHTGSVSLGHASGMRARDAVREAHPVATPHPTNGIFILPHGPRLRDAARRVQDALNNAANFAFANRMFLAVMAIEGLQRVFGDVETSLLYDAPHNFLWQEEIGGDDVTIHRKGACPARGFEAMTDTAFAATGEPVLVPGSMGASSYVLAGRGLEEALASASHGAGRVLSRGAAQRGHEAEFAEFMRRFRVVTPIDLRRPEVRARRDILERKLDEIRQEAPYAYKGIGPVVDTLVGSGMAVPVAELVPLMTVKG
jgi:tRNA-splicing ligase RtcB